MWLFPNYSGEDLFTFYFSCKIYGLTTVDFGADSILPAAHMPTIRWLSASIAWMRASSEPVRGWKGFTVLLRLNAHINKTSFFLWLHMIKLHNDVKADRHWHHFKH